MAQVSETALLNTLRLINQEPLCTSPPGSISGQAQPEPAGSQPASRHRPEPDCGDGAGSTRRPLAKIRASLAWQAFNPSSRAPRIPMAKVHPDNEGEKPSLHLHPGRPGAEPDDHATASMLRGVALIEGALQGPAADL